MMGAAVWYWPYICHMLVNVKKICVCLCVCVCAYVIGRVIMSRVCNAVGGSHRRGGWWRRGNDPGHRLNPIVDSVSGMLHPSSIKSFGLLVKLMVFSPVTVISQVRPAPLVL